MCMATAHYCAGFATGAALATATHQPWWVAVGSASLAAITAGGPLSPDMDQFKPWRALDRWLPDEWLGEGGPLQHRGLSHFWGIPAAVGAYLYMGGGPWWAWMLLAGWVSHLVADWIVGAAGYGRAAGIPLAPWWAHWGLGFKVGGWAEKLLVLVLWAFLARLLYSSIVR